MKQTRRSLYFPAEYHDTIRPEHQLVKASMDPPNKLQLQLKLQKTNGTEQHW